MHGLLLVLPDKPDEERDAVAVAWERRGGTVLRLGRFWDPPDIDPARVRVYGPDTFCLVFAEKLGLHLAAPDDRVLAAAPSTLLGRRLEIMQLGELTSADFPCFVKPVMPKQFRGAVYETLGALLEETVGLKADVEVMVSEIVDFVVEARAFVLDGQVKTCAIYEGEDDVAAATAFAVEATRALTLPKTAVVDVGLLKDGKWVVVECNATWGAGLNGCNPAEAVTCIEAACSG